METQPLCHHYNRKCSIKAVCCNLFYPCHRCHDEIVPSHVMDKKLCREMRCLQCKTIQPISNTCIHCQTQMANYFCNQCVIFDTNDKEVFWHCDLCGVCRKRPVEREYASEHCLQCGVCVPVGHTRHVDLAGYNCPICMEDIQSHYLGAMMPGPCKHLIHTTCLSEYVQKGNYKCPVCSKTYNIPNIESYWDVMYKLVESQPMPSEFKDTLVDVLCNDCGTKHQLPLHFVGYKCPQCKGYNTRQFI